MSGRRPFRAETVGSLLRPPELRAAIDAFYDAGHSAALDEERARDRSALTAIEDAAIREAVRRQLDCGLDVVTDGEFRRWMFMNSFFDAVAGVRTDKTVTFRNDRGEDVELRIHEIAERLRPVDAPAAREAAFLRDVTDGAPFKVTFPAASIFTHPLTTVSGPGGGGYASVADYVEDAVRIERDLVAQAVTAGASTIQFDFPLYPYLVDPAWIARFEEAGHRVADLLDRALAADRAVLDGLPPGVGTALHICRGNYRSSWMCEGSLDPVAERVFDLPYDAFLVEWDDRGRDGGFEPVRFLRPGSLIVMGIVSTKTPVLEDEDDVVRRMEEAAAIAGGMDRLAISPQCGFASVMVGNEIDEHTQWRKLELVGRVADRLWG
ncbi:MAG TPA: cobalamin-independent methionine synthase II family protein [Actinomycetota bacterium]|nr:cobalamin-independent methionine synthase II family protein [Actinomycetota bacterium]